MNIKSLLIGSAAALSSATVASAADAIVAAEPEALEYVRVCDAFGTGYFYIPGTETCLRISGLARFQLNVSPNASAPSDWDAVSRGELTFDARNDTELGTVRSVVRLRGDADNAVAARGVNIHEAYIEVGGFRAGFYENWWDAGLSGEGDDLSSFTHGNGVRYTYTGSGFTAGLAVEELESYDAGFLAPPPFNNNVGITAMLGFSNDAFRVTMLAGYDTDREEGALRAIATAVIGPGTLGVGAVWSSNPNAFFHDSEWAISAQYAVQATDKLTITPGVTYNNDILYSLAGFPQVDSWRYNLTVDYAITSGLNAKLSVTHTDVDFLPKTTTGFLRLDRSF